MDITEYFKSVKGIGILATSDSSGNVDIAMYQKPSVLDEQTVVLVMLQRQSFANIRSNPKAALLFIEEEKLAGKRLYLKMVDEKAEPERIKKLKQNHPTIFQPVANKHVVTFHIENVRELSD
jgi:hypothetical protein